MNSKEGMTLHGCPYLRSYRAEKGGRTKCATIKSPLKGDGNGSCVTYRTLNFVNELKKAFTLLMSELRLPGRTMGANVPLK